MRSISFKVVISFLYLASTTVAEYPEYDYSNEASVPGGSGNVSQNQAVLHPLKYESWYRDFAAELDLISRSVCNLSLAAYRGDQNARATLGPVHDYCWSHADCLLSTVSEHVKASFGGTSILLGLAPTTLSVLGPSVAEMALLSLHRPGLSLLLSLGAPAVFPGRFLLWNDPLRANEASTGAFIIRPFSKKYAILVSVIQYLVAATACGNILHATYAIGLRSIVSWDCRASYWPLIWVVVSLVIHFTATASLRAAIKRKTDITTPRRQQYISEPPNEGQRPNMTGVMTAIHNEVTPSANIDWQVSDLYDVRLGPLAVVLQYTGAFVSVCHLMFGTLLFSSLQFIGVGDAVILIMRLIASATFCRIVLQFEMGGLIRVDEKRVYKGIVQAEEVNKQE
ncbi:hypothetical protein BP6252_10860 [Coleophoma cylindrospora]|uniref:Uncharacterized protein n=1 Tax=Coleophoma cylindrospora TaxID=1849047 RepID=A0A3D8QND6_9HELO|nr:hypothetical protein BP6252_10860 [Coleophoma cylindrospora]